MAENEGLFSHPPTPVSAPPGAGPGAPPAPGGPKPRRGRPAFGVVIGGAVLLRGGREVVEAVARGKFGWIGVLLVGVLALAVVLAWRGWDRRRARLRGGEFTPERVAEQITVSGLGLPAFPEDGTLLGASILAVNQATKVLEVNTTYEVFGSDGQRLGGVRQIGQSRAKMVARVLTVFDQLFTHHFDVLDADDRVALRLTRPRKLFRTKLHVFDGSDRYLGTIQQENVFWKIRFQLTAPNGQVLGYLRAENLRAWDFHVYDSLERPVASLVKAWEGWGRTAFSRADRYTARIHEPLASPLRELTVAAALAVDLALKQDARGIG